MASYYNPYNFYPVSYGGSLYPTNPPAQMPQQSWSPPPQAEGIHWVEGEVGAKAFQRPNGWPDNQPIPLWDSTDTVIYLKSWGPMGIPNPLQKLRYEMPEQQTQALPAGMSGSTDRSQAVSPDLSQFVTKQDLDQLKNEIRSMLTPQGNQNGGNNNASGNRGGSR